jgi:hypothetical protein
MSTVGYIIGGITLAAIDAFAVYFYVHSRRI